MKMTLRLTRDLAASRQARWWVREQLDPLALESARLEIIELLVTELVTNVVEHTESAPTLTLEADDGQVHVAVEDDGGGLARVADPDPERLGGWGLRIVDELADSWGASYQATGTKVLWFTVATSI